MAGRDISRGRSDEIHGEASVSGESLDSVRHQRTAAFIGRDSRTRYNPAFDAQKDWEENVTSVDRLGNELGYEEFYNRDGQTDSRRRWYRTRRNDSSDEEGARNSINRRSPHDIEQRDRRVSTDFFPGFSSRDGEIQETIRRTRERREEMETWQGGKLQSREAWSEAHESHEDISKKVEQSDDEDSDHGRTSRIRKVISSNEEKQTKIIGNPLHERITYTTKADNRNELKQSERGTASMTLAVGQPEAVNGEIARATVPKQLMQPEEESSPDSDRQADDSRRVPLYSTVNKGKRGRSSFRDTDRDSFYYNNLVANGQEDRESSTAGLTPADYKSKRWFVVQDCLPNLSFVPKIRNFWFGLHANISWVYAALLIAVGTALISVALISSLITPYAYIWFLLVLILIGLIALLIFYVLAFIRSRKNDGRASPTSRTESGFSQPHQGGTLRTNEEVVSTGRSDLNPSYLSSGVRSERAKRWPNIGHVPLRAAIILLGLCALLFAIFWFILHLYVTCLDDVFKVLAIIAALFIILQLPLLYINRKMNELKSHFLAKWGMMHIFVVDVLLAFLAMFFIIDYHIRYRMLSGNYSNLTCDQIDNFTFIHSGALRICEFDHPFAKQFYFASLALYPLFIIFLFLACVILVFAWKNLSSHFRYYREDDRSLQSWVGAKAYGALCGAILGALLIILTIVMIVMFFVFWNSYKNPSAAYLSFRGIELCINIVIIILLIVAPFVMRKMGIDQLKDMSLYTVIFVFAILGLFLYEVFYAVACHHIKIDRYILGLMKSVISIIAATFQTIFLLVGMRLYCLTATQIHDAPGRSTITLLLMCNISLILLNIFENFINEFDMVAFNVFGLVPWTIIQHVFVPFLILYRIICAIAAIVIWTKAYEIPRRAFQPVAKALY